MSAYGIGIPAILDLTDAPHFTDALCSQTDPDAYFPDKGQSNRVAKAVCAQCPEQTACLAWALENHEPYGIWGGTTERERRHLLHQRKIA